MLDATAIAEQRRGQRDDAEDDRISPDQGSQNEVGTQAAEPAVAARLVPELCCSALMSAA